jgi:hypothetical protein
VGKMTSLIRNFHNPADTHGHSEVDEVKKELELKKVKLKFEQK